MLGEEKHSIVSATERVLTTAAGTKIKLLQLPDGEDWHHLSHPILFVRDFYESFYDEYFGSYKKKLKVIVTGTPGIGKSAFGVYCIFRALKDGKTVVYNSAKRHLVFYVYSATTVYTTTNAVDIARLLDDFANVVYLSDALRPDVFPCPTGCFTSPKKDVWYEFSKEQETVLKIFGKWNRSNELELLREHCFSKVSVATMNQQVNIWGEIPRASLASSDNPSSSKRMADSLINTSDASVIIRSEMLKETGKGDPFHRLIHLVPTENFEDGGRAFASSYVADKLFDHYDKEFESRMRSFLSDYDSTKSHLGGLAGPLFERLAWKTISAGGTFKMVNLTDKIESEVELPKMGIIDLKDVGDIDFKSTACYKPTSNIFGAVDFISVLPSDLWLINATIDKDHKVLMDSADGKSGLQRLTEKLQPNSTVKKFVFAFPPNVFDKFMEKKNLMPIAEWKLSNVEKKNALITRLPVSEQNAFRKTFKWFAICIPINRKYHTFRKLIR